MTYTIVNPQGEPNPHPGHLEHVTYDYQKYNAAEVDYRARAKKEHMLQSCSSGQLSVYGEYDNPRVDYLNQYGLRFSFHNYTGRDIVVVDRLGMPVTITPEKRMPKSPEYKGLFMIRKEMYFDNDQVALRVHQNILSLGKLQGRELSLITPGLLSDLNWNQYGRCLALQYFLTYEEILAGDGRLYHLPTDLVISLLSAADTIRHPCSAEFTHDLNKAYLPNYSQGDKDIRVVYRYITSDVKAAPKYLRLGKFIFMLEPETAEPARVGVEARGKDKVPTAVELSEYIEVLYPAHHDATRNGVSGWRRHCMTIEQAKESGEIFDTLEDARHPVQAAERERQKHKDELAAQAAKHAEVVRSLEAKILKQEEDALRFKRLVDELQRARDIELERLREANEKATHRRRLSYENIKLLVTLVTAAVTLGTVYAKYKSSQSTASST